MVSRMMIAGVCMLSMLGAVGTSAERAGDTAPALEKQNDNCKDVKITIRNLQPLKIRVAQLHYRDRDVDKWRTETTWTALDVESGSTKSRKRNLEHVLNDETKLLVRYRKYRPDAGWTGLYSSQGGTFVCQNEMNVVFTVD